MAHVLAHIVGDWGAVFVNIGLIISVLGAWLGWTLLAGELPYVVAKNDLFPKWFAKENRNGAPVNSLLITNILVQLFLISMLFTESAYQFAFSLASSAILIPYMFSAFYLVKYNIAQRETSMVRWITGGVASIYAIWLIYAAGLEYLLLTMILYIPGVIVFIKVQNNLNKKPKTVEWVIIGLILLFAIIGIVKLMTHSITVI